MRRLRVGIPLIAAALLNVGCVMVIGSRELPDHKHVVQIDDELYIVDVKTKRVRKLDLEAAVRAQTERETSPESAED